MLMAKYFSTGLLFVDVEICIYQEINFLFKKKKKAYLMFIIPWSLRCYKEISSIFPCSPKIHDLI